MRLFKTSQGFIISFGFNMIGRTPDLRMICWCDPETGDWETKLSNMAGNIILQTDIYPEFVRECAETVIAYQPGRCFEMQFLGQPIIWSVRTLST